MDGTYLLQLWATGWNLPIVGFKQTITIPWNLSTVDLTHKDFRQGIGTCPWG
jgi:hypothetical protein